MAGFDFRRCTSRFQWVILVAIQDAQARDQKPTADDAAAGLLGVDQGVGRAILKNLSVDLHEFIPRTGPVIDSSNNPPKIDQSQLSKELFEVLEEAKRQSSQLGHSYLGTEHLVLAIVAHGAGKTVQWLNQRGVTIETVKDELRRILLG